MDPHRKVWYWGSRKINVTSGTLATKYARHGAAITRLMIFSA
jgi:hypothetical protein